MCQESRMSTMKIHEQAFFSGLVFADENDKTEPQWRRPPLLGGNRTGHTSVVVRHPVSKHDEHVVIIGGCLHGTYSSTNSVILLRVDSKKWQQGPPMQKGRDWFASVVCNGALYAIGGKRDDSIERTNVEELFQHSSSSFTSSTNGWTMLNCRLSTKREGCAAAVVHDRFIVVAGGCYGLTDGSLSSVDILDTACGNSCTVTSGPSLVNPRRCFGMAVIRQRIYAVGRSDRGHVLSPVEYLEFDDLLDGKANSTKSVFPSTKSWMIHEDLMPRVGHAVVQVGSCIVVAGGFTPRGSPFSVEVLDADKHICVGSFPT